MHVEVHIPAAERIESLRSHIQRRLHSGIGQHADRVRRVSVQLSEFWGPARGSTWTSCRIEADDESLPKGIVAEAYEENPYRAFDKAIDRLSHSLDRALLGPARRTPDAGFAKVESIAQRRRPRQDSETAPSAVPKARRSWQSA
jgi:ribosome-associated translation inhibitor RaiA